MSTAEHRTNSWGFTPEEEAQYAAEREEARREIAERMKNPPPEPKRMVDEHGRLLPLPADYLEAQARAIRELREEFARMPDDDPPGAHEAAMRGIDEERRRLGMRTLFDGYFAE